MLVVTSNNGKLIIQLEWPNCVFFVCIYLIYRSYTLWRVYNKTMIVDIRGEPAHVLSACTFDHSQTLQPLKSPWPVTF